MATALAISGASGRMGRRIIALAHEDASVRIAAALERAGHELTGADAGEIAGIGRLGVAIAPQPPGEFDVLIDFTTPEGTLRNLDLCRRVRRAIVIGTTGHDAEQLDVIRAASRDIPVLKAANMSVGVNVALKAVELLAAALNEGFDVEIVESHHRFKEDAPSGSALALLEAVRRGRASQRGPGHRPLDGESTEVTYGRHGRTGARPTGEIGMHSLRIGDTVGEHTVSFGSLGETISIHHSAHSRDTFAGGAIRAAKWLAGRPPGLYGMNDVLFSQE